MGQNRPTNSIEAIACLSLHQKSSHQTKLENSPGHSVVDSYREHLTSAAEVGKSGWNEKGTRKHRGYVGEESQSSP